MRCELFYQPQGQTEERALLRKNWVSLWTGEHETAQYFLNTCINKVELAVLTPPPFPNFISSCWWV
jgi:hypothetical protein